MDTEALEKLNDLKNKGRLVRKNLIPLRKKY